MANNFHIMYWNDYEISFTFHPSSRGHCDRLGCPEEPDTPAEVEIDRIYNELTGTEVDPDDFSRREELEEACFDFAQQQIE